MARFKLLSPVKNLFRPFLKTTFNRRLTSAITSSTTLDCLDVLMALVKIVYLLFIKSSLTFTLFQMMSHFQPKEYLQF